MAETESLFGKKVLFLYPPGVLSDVANTLASHEFEVYLIHNYKNVVRYLRKNPESLLFANIDDGMPEPEWEAWIRALKSESSTSSVGIGVVTMLSDAELSRKYLMDIGITCGFIILKIGAAKTADILLKTLEANEARGRRKYIRAACPPDTAELTAPAEGATIRGTILDISSVGIAATLDSPQSMPVGTRLKDVQLSLRGARIFVNGIIVGKRTEGDAPPAHVILFEPASVTDEKKEKLRAFIHRILQEEMNRQLEIA